MLSDDEDTQIMLMKVSLDKDISPVNFSSKVHKVMDVKFDKSQLSEMVDGFELELLGVVFVKGLNDDNMMLG